MQLGMPSDPTDILEGKDPGNHYRKFLIIYSCSSGNDQHCSAEVKNSEDAFSIQRPYLPVGQFNPDGFAELVGKSSLQTECETNALQVWKNAAAD